MILFDQLDAEWRQSIAGNQGLARRLPCLFDVTGGRILADAYEWIEHATPEDADRALHVLAGLAANGDELAARVLLQRLLPGTRRLARRWWAIRDVEERAATTVAAVWGRIVSYPIDRRPQRIAANILLDSASDLRRTVASHLRAPACAGLRPDDDEPLLPQIHPALELLDVLTDAVAAGVISTSDAELIAGTRVLGRSLRETTDEPIAVRTLQWRRRRAESALVGTRQAA